MTYNITGTNNKIVLFDDDGMEIPVKKEIDGLSIVCNGNDNVIRIHKDTKFYTSLIHIGNDKTNVEIGKSSCLCINVRCCFGEGQVFKIGDGTQIGQTTFYLDEQSGCCIGKDCMFSNGITVWGADGHGILGCRGGGVYKSGERTRYHWRPCLGWLSGDNPERIKDIRQFGARGVQRSGEKI